MSSEFLGWAVKAKIGRSSTKNLLMIVADLANAMTREVFGSLAYYQEATGLSKRTVLDCLDELVGLKILEVTDDRRGHTNQIPVYLFAMSDQVELMGRPHFADKRGAKTSPFRKQVQKSSETGAVLHGKEAQKRTTEPSILNQVMEDSPSPPSGEAPPGGEIDLFGDAVVETTEALIDHVVSEWKVIAEEFPQIQRINVLSDARRLGIRKRADEVVRARGGTLRSAWDEIFRAIRASRFLRGEADPGKGFDRPFSLSIDYLLRPKKFHETLERIEIDERHERNTSNQVTGRRFGPAEQAGRRALDRLRAGRTAGVRG